MIISVFGQTDKRPVIYTLMKLFQTLGDTCIISNNRHYCRLTETGSQWGMYQNVAIFVTDATADEVFHEIEHDIGDYDYIIMDNLYTEDADLNIYVEGAGKEPLDEDLLLALEDSSKTINLGFGKSCVPYSATMFKNLEIIEYYKKLVPVDARLTQKLANILAPHLDLKPANIIKVVNRK